MGKVLLSLLCGLLLTCSNACAWKTNFHGKQVTGTVLQDFVSTLSVAVHVNINNLAFNCWQADVSSTKHCAEYAHRVTKYQQQFNSFGRVPCPPYGSLPVCVCNKPGAEEGATHYLIKAREAYLKKDYKTAEEFLGYAIHYIEDSLCPSHVFAFKEGIPDVHGDFENWAEDQSSRWIEIMKKAQPFLFADINDLKNILIKKADWVAGLPHSYRNPDDKIVNANTTALGNWVRRSILGNVLWEMRMEDLEEIVLEIGALIKGAMLYVVMDSAVSFKVITARTNVQGIAFSKDERFLAFGAGTNVYIYETYYWSLYKTLTIGSTVNDLCFSTNGKWLAVAAGNCIRIFDTSSWMELPTSPLHVGAVCLSVTFSHDSRWLFGGTAWQDAHIYVYETERWQLISKFGASMDKNSIAISPNEQFVCITSSYKYYPSIWNTNRWGKVLTLNGGYGEYNHNTYWYGAQFSPDGKWLVYGFVDQVKKEYSIFTHIVGMQWPIINKITWRCAYCGPGNVVISPDGKMLAHGGDGVHIFRVESPGMLRQIWFYPTLHPIPQHSLAFSAYGTWLAYADGKEVHIRRVSSIPTGVCLGNICLETPSWVASLVGVVIIVVQLLNQLIK